jgi:hypothetical protein
VIQPAVRALLVGAVSLSLTACGGGDTSDNASDAPSTVPTPTERTLTEAQAKVIAEASLLKAADMPGYEATPPDETEDPEEEKAEAELEKCVGSESPDYLADEASDDFSKGEPPAGVEVSSEVQVVKTFAEGEADLKAFLSDKALGCLETFFGKALDGELPAGVTVGKPTVERFDIAKPAEASEAFGLRIQSTLSGQGMSLDFSIALAGALVGRAELSVISTGFGQEFPVAEQARLLAVMSTRAATAQKA